MNLLIWLLLGFAMYKIVTAKGYDCSLWGILAIILCVHSI